MKQTESSGNAGSAQMCAPAFLALDCKDLTIAKRWENGRQIVPCSLPAHRLFPNSPTHHSRATQVGAAGAVGTTGQCRQCHGSLGAPKSPSATRGPPSHHRTGQEPQSCCPRKPEPHGLPLYQLSSPSLPSCPRPAFKLKPHALSETSLCTEGLQTGNGSPAQPSSAGATHKAGSRAQHQLCPLPTPPASKASLTGGRPQPCDIQHSPARPAAPPHPLPRAEQPAAPPRPAPRTAGCGSSLRAPRSWRPFPPRRAGAAGHPGARCGNADGLTRTPLSDPTGTRRLTGTAQHLREARARGTPT